MTDTMTMICNQGGIAKLLIQCAAGATLSVPSMKTAADRQHNADREAERLNPHPAGEAWCAWWIDGNGDTPTRTDSDEGLSAIKTLFAFRAGWDGATK